MLRVTCALTGTRPHDLGAPENCAHSATARVPLALTNRTLSPPVLTCNYVKSQPLRSPRVPSAPETAASPLP